jgi:hypothetical protein
MTNQPYLSKLAKSGSCVAFAAIVLSVIAAGPANASIQLAVSPDNVTYTALTLTPLGGGQYQYVNAALPIGGVNFDVNFTATTNSPGTPTLAELIDLETTVRQNGAGGGNRNVYIRLIDDTFTQPTGAGLTLSSKLELLGGEQGGPGDRTLTSTFIGDSNQTLGPHGIGTFTTGAFTSNLSPFTLQNITFVFLTPNESVTTRSTTSITRDGGVVPESASVVVWGILAATCGLGAWRRSS